MDFINKKAVPDVELSEEDLDALGSLSKTNVKGMQFNPYTKIDPKYMDLNNAIESDDDDEWFYATVGSFLINHNYNRYHPNPK